MPQPTITGSYTTTPLPARAWRALAGATVLVLTTVLLTFASSASAQVARGTATADRSRARGGGRNLLDVTDDFGSMARSVLLIVAMVGFGAMAVRTGFDRRFGIAIPAFAMFLLALVVLAPGGTTFLENTANTLSVGN